MTRRVTIAVLALLAAFALPPLSAAPSSAQPRYAKHLGVGPIRAVTPRYHLTQRRERFRRERLRRRPPGRLQPRGYRYRYGERARQSCSIPMNVAARRVRARYPGRILDARLQGSSYVFKILSRGRLVRARVSCR